MSTMSVEITWAATHTLDQQPALGIVSRYAREDDAVWRSGTMHCIPAADLAMFSPPLSIWQLIEVACDPALQAQIKLAQSRERVEAAKAKRDRKAAGRVGIVHPKLDDVIRFGDLDKVHGGDALLATLNTGDRRLN